LHLTLCYFVERSLFVPLCNDFVSITGLLLALGTVDAFLLHYAFNSVAVQGPSVQLVFGLEVQWNLVCKSHLFKLTHILLIMTSLQYAIMIMFLLQYAILLIMLVGTAMKYILHTIDLQNENPWENKMVYLLYTDVVLGEWLVSIVTMMCVV